MRWIRSFLGLSCQRTEIAPQKLLRTSTREYVDRCVYMYFVGRLTFSESNESYIWRVESNESSCFRRNLKSAAQHFSVRTSQKPKDLKRRKEERAFQHFAARKNKAIPVVKTASHQAISVPVVGALLSHAGHYYKYYK